MRNNKNWKVEILDDRPSLPTGPVTTRRYFRDQAAGFNWLANWIKKDMDEEGVKEDKRKRFLAMIEAQDFDTLIREYGDTELGECGGMLMYKRKIE